MSLCRGTPKSIGKYPSLTMLLHVCRRASVQNSTLSRRETSQEQQTAAALDADYASTCALLGMVLMKTEQYDQAIEFLTQALMLDKTNAHWSYMLGVCFARMLELDLAHESFSCAIELDRTHALAYYERGACELRSGNAAGIRDTNNALTIEPGMWTAYLTRACYYGHIGRYNKAILNCNRAIDLEPRSVRAYITRGCLKCQNQNFAGGIEDLTTAIEIDPSCSLAYYNRAVCHRMWGDTDAAIRDYTYIIDMDAEPNPVVYLNRGLILFERKEYTAALSDFEAVATGAVIL